MKELFKRRLGKQSDKAYDESDGGNVNTYIKLIESWKLDEESLKKNEYMSEADSRYFNLKDHSTDIDFSVPPQPFWGNIVNPSVIVLFNNPNINSENVNHDYQNALLKNIQGMKPFDFLENKDGNYCWLNKDSKYWQDRFREIKSILQNDVLKISNFNEYIGEFEFHGYNSQTFRKFNCKDDKHGYLPTQVALFDHIKYLIQKYQPLIVIARGRKNWIEALRIDENDKHTIDVRSPQSAYLTKRENNKGNIESDQFERIIERIENDYRNKKPVNRD